jgi:hypothetical protein
MGFHEETTGKFNGISMKIRDSNGEIYFNGYYFVNSKTILSLPE